MASCSEEQLGKDSEDCLQRHLREKVLSSPVLWLWLEDWLPVGSAGIPAVLDGPEEGKSEPVQGPSDLESQWTDEEN
jgi:hypothetical protein